MRQTLAAAAALFATISTVRAAAPTCSPSSPCPASAPCCSQYGQCGVGAYCLGGCDPTSSFNLQSCMAGPVCKSQDYKMDSLDDIAANTIYLGDASSVNWVSSGKPAEYNGDSVLLTMAPSTVGTLLTSTHYVWYGKVSATMTTSQGQGVVTAFILMSDVKDEIDFEFVGDDVTSAQSNYYYQGITDYHNMVPLDVSDTRQNTHTYEIDWTPDTLTWSIDGNSMRTLNKADTWNDTTNSYHYPQTPARVQLSLWPAGLPSNQEGTISWAGGLVNWDNSEDMANGYYYAVIQDVTVECYDPPSGFSNNFGSDAYYYTSTVGTNNTVAIGNNNTILGSFLASGNNPDYGSPKASASSSGSAPAPTQSDIQTVPGISGGGNAASSGESPSTGQGDGSSSSSSDSSSSGSGSTGAGGGSTSFSQGVTDSTTGSSGAPKIVAGSVVALLGFFVAALMM